VRSKCRLVILATMLAAVLALPASASAQIDQFSLSPEVQLGPEGASATTTVTVQCVEGLDAFLEVNVVQNTGGRLASGAGFSSFTCTGEPQTQTVPVRFSIFALKQGKATATATLRVIDLIDFEPFVTETTGPIAVRVRKK
jgi:hypothetical protein